MCELQCLLRCRCVCVCLCVGVSLSLLCTYTLRFVGNWGHLSGDALTLWPRTSLKHEGDMNSVSCCSDHSRGNFFFLTSARCCSWCKESFSFKYSNSSFFTPLPHLWPNIELWTAQRAVCSASGLLSSAIGYQKKNIFPHFSAKRKLNCNNCALVCGGTCLQRELPVQLYWEIVFLSLSPQRRIGEAAEEEGVGGRRWGQMGLTHQNRRVRLMNIFIIKSTFWFCQ